MWKNTGEIWVGLGWEMVELGVILAVASCRPHGGLSSVTHCTRPCPAGPAPRRHVDEALVPLQVCRRRRTLSAVTCPVALVPRVVNVRRTNTGVRAGSLFSRTCYFSFFLLLGLILSSSSSSFGEET